MISFYFNNIFRVTDKDKLQEQFEQIIKDFAILTSHDYLEIEKSIITETDPKDLSIGEVTLAHLIRNCEDISIRRRAYALFTKYPDKVHYNTDEVLHSETDLEDHFLNKLSAYNLLVPFYKGWILFSIPHDSNLKVSPIEISSKNGKIKELINFYGENLNKIAHHIISNQFINPDSKQEILHPEKFLRKIENSLGRNKVFFTEDFIANFENMQVEEQKAITDMIKDYYNNGWFFPIKADNKHIKKCEEEDNEQTYELRKLGGTGIRVYVKGLEDGLIFATTHTKAIVSQDKSAQSKIIDHATRVADKLIESIKKGERYSRKSLL